MVYAQIENGVCKNTVEATAIFAAVMGLVELPEGFGIGDFYDGQTWTHEAREPELEPTAEEILNTLLGVTE